MQNEKIPQFIKDKTETITRIFIRFFAYKNLLLSTQEQTGRGYNLDMPQATSKKNKDRIVKIL